MAALAQARIDYRTFLRTPDEVERLVDLTVAEKVLKREALNEQVREKNLAGLIGVRVGSIVGRALNEALQAIARSMR